MANTREFDGKTYKIYRRVGTGKKAANILAKDLRDNGALVRVIPTDRRGVYDVYVHVKRSGAAMYERSRTGLIPGSIAAHQQKMRKSAKKR